MWTPYVYCIILRSLRAVHYYISSHVRVISFREQRLFYREPFALSHRIYLIQSCDDGVGGGVKGWLFTQSLSLSLFLCPSMSLWYLWCSARIGRIRDDAQTCKVFEFEHFFFFFCDTGRNASVQFYDGMFFFLCLYSKVIPETVFRSYPIFGFASVVGTLERWYFDFLLKNGEITSKINHNTAIM